MSGSAIGRMGHSCGSRQGLNLFEEADGRITGFCFSCRKYEPDPLNGNTMERAGIKRTERTQEEIQQELDEIASYKSHGIEDRGIGLGTVRYFGVKTTLDEERQEKVAVHYYPYTSITTGKVDGYKFRIVEGKIIRSVGNMKRVYPFGWDKAIKSGSPTLYITEGEIDAMSLFSVIMQNNQKKDKYAEYIPAVVSIPHGAAGASRDLSLIVPDIRKHFKDVVLVFDNDDAGRAAVEDTLKVLPEAKVAVVPGKDVNECVMEGHVKALFKSVVFDAKVPKNTRLVYAEDLFESAKQPPTYGLSWPWKQTTKQTRGIRFGETVYIGAAQKMG